jgi:cell pole-organizing protein PopZ
MSRDRTEVLQSIAQLIKEVNAVAFALNKGANEETKRKLTNAPSIGYKENSNVFPIKKKFDGLISQSQIEQVVETLVNSYEINGKTADRKTLQTLVDQLIKSTINGWISNNLESVVSEAVERELAKTIEDKRFVG